ncbi:hypothetical protein [Tenacibaculum sp. UWU-22]|uniref:hypothetical protein n=1 Tax=Tenacibaculum sp. UWU-22 TaxID=3234187 RepID=UPI0034DB7432
MKKNVLKIAACLSIIIALTTSCTNDDSSNDSTISSIDPANFQGTIESGRTVTLDASKTYHLTGKLLVEAGATLNIPEGTHIVGEKGATYIIVDRDAKIYINGTASNPVIFDGASHTQGYWGGIVILGNAPSNRSANGTSTSELGDLTYGGTNSADSSGSIKYCVIKDTGFKYNPEKEFNGLSLFGCGSGTTISYVYVANGADDAIESFGGSPKYDHLVLIGNQDDSFDWTEGFSGTASYVYASRDKQYQDTSDPGNRGFECDTQDTDPETTNGNGASTPHISNITVIGNKAGSESQALKLRAGTEGFFDNVVLANFDVGINIETARSFEWFGTGDKITNVNFVEVNTSLKLKAYSGSSVTWYSENSSATGAGNGTALPDWAKGWTGLTSWDIVNASN